MFHFVDGNFDQPAGIGIEGLYEGPYYGYFRCDLLQKAHDLATLSTALQTTESKDSCEEAYELLYSVIEEEGPFDGVIGFSHGATLAFQFLLQHAKKNPLEPDFALFRCAVFMAGPPPFGEDGMRLRKTEGQGPLLRLPTVHIVGKDDFLYQEALNLHGLCDEKSAKLLIHEKGHLVPRDKKSTGSMAKAIKELGSRIVVM